MTIGAYGTSAVSAQRSTDLFRSIRGDLSAVQAQLSTGKQATTYAGLGTGVVPSLTLRAKLSSLDQYDANIADGTLRLNVASAGLTQIGKVTAALKAGLSDTTAGVTPGISSTVVVARTGLDAIVDVLNTNLNGRYLFAGRAADTQPVASADLILNGDANRAGLATLIAQRKAADVGPNGLGRLTVSTSGSTVLLGEEAAGLSFGLKLSGASATGTALSATLAGTPATANISLAAQPAVGDAFTLTLTLPDGTVQPITLAAGAGQSGDGTIGFAVGATAGDTAQNIAAALTAAVTSVVSSTLPSASAVKTATVFFAADAANPPARIAGPPYDTATATVPGTSADTVIWYAGDTSSSPRETAPVRIGDQRTIGIGAQANEPAFRQILAGFAVVAAESFPSSDSTSAGRFAALSGRVSSSLSSGDGPQSLVGMSADLSVASASLKAASGNIAVSRSQTQDTLAGIENADPAEAATKLMATQTRLQASYQVTAALQKLSLVNYL